MLHQFCCFQDKYSSMLHIVTFIGKKQKKNTYLLVKYLSYYFLIAQFTYFNEKFSSLTSHLSTKYNLLAVCDRGDSATAQSGRALRTDAAARSQRIRREMGVTTAFRYGF